jgi:protein gp37
VENTAIEWADHTFNAWLGCTKVGPGCARCYAETLMDTRYGKVEWGRGKPRVLTSDANWKKPLSWDRKAAKEGRRPRVFCMSLADLFDDEVPDAWHHGLWKLIDRCQDLDWLCLTKRPENYGRYLPWLAKHPGLPDPDGRPWPHVWLGTTVENRRDGLPRVDLLRQTPAAVRFLSAEPLLEDLGAFDLAGIGWVIAGGESGPGFRPMLAGWARGLRDHCARSGVAFFFKQWSGFNPKRLGRELDGRTHDELPGRRVALPVV